MVAASLRPVTSAAFGKARAALAEGLVARFTQFGDGVLFIGPGGLRRL